MDAVKRDIITYLNGPRVYREGVVLYVKHGANRMLKKYFQHNDTISAHAMLMEELRKLSGLSAKEFAVLPRKAVAKNVVADISIPVAEDSTQKCDNAPEVVNKMIRFREKYPFLREDTCPDVLKVLVSDMFTAYGKYKEAYAALQELPDVADVAEAATLAERVVENYLSNREIWDELDYYREHGQILGKCAKLRALEKAKEFENVSDVELMKMLQSARTNVSKNKAKVENLKSSEEDSTEAESLLEKWISRKSTIEKEIEKRKKK